MHTPKHKLYKHAYILPHNHTNNIHLYTDAYIHVYNAPTHKYSPISFTQTHPHAYTKQTHVYTLTHTHT